MFYGPVSDNKALLLLLYILKAVSILLWSNFHIILLIKSIKMLSNVYHPRFIDIQDINNVSPSRKRLASF